MKSIKEKAEENCIKYGNLGNVAYQEFEAGANYVLEVVESILEDQELDVKETYYKICATIKELKK